MKEKKAGANFSCAMMKTQKYALYVRPLMAYTWLPAVHADDLNCHYVAFGNKHLI